METGRDRCRLAAGFTAGRNDVSQLDGAGNDRPGVHIYTHNNTAADDRKRYLFGAADARPVEVNICRGDCVTSLMDHNLLAGAGAQAYLANKRGHAGDKTPAPLKPRTMDGGGETIRDGHY